MYDPLFALGLQALFYTVTLLFVLYSASIAYHWFAYGTDRSLSMLSLAIYLVGSAPLFLVMALCLTLI